MSQIYSCIFIKNSLKPQLRDIDRTTVKTGLGRRYGNKGAVISRFVIGDSSIAFINCHLAAGQNALRQRNKDLIGILETHSSLRVAADLEPNACKHHSFMHSIHVLTSVTDIGGGDGSIVNDHDSKLNSTLACSCLTRCSLHPERRPEFPHRHAKRYRHRLCRAQGVRDAPGTRSATQADANECRVPAKILQRSTDRFCAHLQVRPVSPNVVLSIPADPHCRGTHDYDSSEKQRAPAYCDRILWRTLAQGEDVVPLHYQRYEPTVSDHRPVSAALDFRIKQIGHSRRTTTRRQIFTEWQKKEQSLLERAKQYYGM